MSKRDQGASLITYIENGYLPEAVRNFLCLLGWSPKDDREKLDLAEVVRIFDLAKVHRKNAAFDLEKCTWLNGEYLRELSDDRFREMGRQALERAGFDLWNMKNFVMLVPKTFDDFLFDAFISKKLHAALCEVG